MTEQDIADLRKALQIKRESQMAIRSAYSAGAEALKRARKSERITEDEYFAQDEQGWNAVIRAIASADEVYRLREAEIKARSWVPSF